MNDVVRSGAVRFGWSAGGVRIFAVLRPRDFGGQGGVRVWVGQAGQAEDFSLDEARWLCARAGDVLVYNDINDIGVATVALDLPCSGDGGGAMTGRLSVPGEWLFAFRMAVQQVLRTEAELRSVHRLLARFEDWN